MSNAKQAAAQKALQYIQAGMLVGLGTGSTAYFFIEALGQAVQQGLQIQAVATSDESEAHARSIGIEVLPVGQAGVIDVTVDGTDEFDPNLNLIKGGGGALYREKMIASLSRELIIIADTRKQVQTLGAFPLPVEVVPFGVEITQLRLNTLGAKAHLRLNAEGNPYQTDNQNYILDCHFNHISDPGALHQTLKSYLGVVETGLFVQMAHRVLLGHADGHVDDILPVPVAH
jgi:ribose 5-phosphate isomerase A